MNLFRLLAEISLSRPLIACIGPDPTIPSTIDYVSCFALIFIHKWTELEDQVLSI